MDRRNFEAAVISEEIKHCHVALAEILQRSERHDELSQLTEIMDKIRNEEKIKMAFIGQYTAGKSSIISAITGNDEIIIDSDISTSSATSYEWGGIYLTDTPGLHTENTSHDEITKLAIKESDLLVYCITSDLFNEYTLEDFKKWAYEYSYSEKMFLVVNKMSKEAGEYDELVKNYKITINNSLSPNSIEEFNYTFVDAKDYRDGTKEYDVELKNISHFDSLINQLNRFVRVKGQLAKLDTPIKAIVDIINQIYINEMDDEQTKSYLTILSRLEKRVECQKKQAINDFNYIIRKELNKIIIKGYELSRAIGSDEIDFTETECQSFIEDICVGINDSIDAKMVETREELAKEVADVLESEIAEFYFEQVSSNEKKSSFNPFKNKEYKINKERIEAISSITEKASSGLVKLSYKSGAEVSSNLMKASQAAGSQTHKVVLTLGEKMGYKFKPWEAAKIAKNIGNVAKFVGPVLSVLRLVLDIKEVVDEEVKLKKIRKAQEEHKQNFRNIADEIEEQYAKQINDYIKIYSQVLDEIKVAKKDVTKEIDKNKSVYKEIKIIENKLNDLQSSIFMCNQ